MLYEVITMMFVFSQGKTMMIQTATEPDKSIKIAVVSSPKIIGKYAQSVYNVALATLSSRRSGRFSLQQYDLQDESSTALEETFAKLREDKVDAVLAPLTGEGAKNLARIDTNFPIFIPTVHKRDIPSAPDNIVFGGIDS